MSSELPALKLSELVRALEKANFYIIRQSGSHVILYKEGLPRPIPVPIHPKGLKKNLQTTII
jgi:predicted RNA binding protein YcfA (HicA-like mRNA interferase family)